MLFRMNSFIVYILRCDSIALFLVFFQTSVAFFGKPLCLALSKKNGAGAAQETSNMIMCGIRR